MQNLLSQKAPSYVSNLVSSFTGHLSSGAEASVGRGKALQRDEALALLTVLGQPVRVEEQRDVSHYHQSCSYSGYFHHLLFNHCGRGQAAKDMIRKMPKMRSRRL